MSAAHVVFLHQNVISKGDLSRVLTDLKAAVEEGENPASLLTFAVDTGQQVDFDLRGSLPEVLERYNASGKRGRGRPRLGVVSREITLLPKHWQWLQSQPGSPSATLRTLVDQAMANDDDARPIAAVWRVASAIGGNLPNFEEATRALYRGDFDELSARMAGWPRDLHQYIVEELRL